MYSNCPFQMPPLQAGPSRPSRGAGRGDPSRRRGRRRAPVIDDEESSEEESAHPQSKTSADREEGSGSGSESGGDVGEDPEDDSSDLDDGADGGITETAQAKRMKRSSQS